MRWLLLKDLQILRRSPLLVGILVAYPVVISVLIGLALSRGPDKPRVAFVNEVPPSQATFQVGSRTIDATRYADRLFQAIDPVRVRSPAAGVPPGRARRGARGRRGSRRGARRPGARRARRAGGRHPPPAGRAETDRVHGAAGARGRLWPRGP